MENKFEITANVLGPDEGMEKEIRVLNRALRWTESGITYEPDQRHDEIIIGFGECALTLHAWLKAEDCASFKKSRSISRAMSHAMTHGTRSTSSSSFSSVPGPTPPRRLTTSTTPCADPRKPQECGSYPERPPHTGYEPNRIVDNQIIHEQENATCTEDDQITEIEDHVKTLSYNQSFLSSIQDSAGSIAKLQEADFDVEQIRALLASPRYLPEGESSAERSQAYLSERESLMSSSSQGLKSVGTGKPAVG